jgi:prevent-host-death family protein
MYTPALLSAKETEASCACVFSSITRTAPAGAVQLSHAKQPSASAIGATAKIATAASHGISRLTSSSCSSSFRYVRSKRISNLSRFRRPPSFTSAPTPSLTVSRRGADTSASVGRAGRRGGQRLPERRSWHATIRHDGTGASNLSDCVTMQHMKKASIRELHIRTSDLVREAKNGEVIVIENRGEPVAELRPLSKATKPGLPDMTRFWTEFPEVSGDSGRFLEEDR